MGNIEWFKRYLDPIEEVIYDFFLPSLFEQADPLPQELKELVTLSPAQGGIGIPDLKCEAPEQFKASSNMTGLHIASIIVQSSTLPAREEVEELKHEINSQRRAATKSRIDRINAYM